MTSKHTPICIPIRESSMAAALMQIQEVQKHADVVEIWLDHIEDLNIERLFEVKEKPYLCVHKSKREKGKFMGTTEKRFEILKTCVNRGAEVVDINIEVPFKWIKNLAKVKKSTKLLISYHNFQKTPSYRILARLTERMMRLGGDIAKISTFVSNAEDIATLFKLAHYLSKKNIRHVIIGMGAKGKITRIASPLMENEWMYAPVDDKKGSAPGQLTVQELGDLWNKIF